MRRAEKSWSNRQQAQNADEPSANTMWKFLLLAVICAAFLCYALPHMQTGANFTASGSATATFVFNPDKGSPLNLEAVPSAQLKKSSSATAQASSAASSSESAAPSSAVTTPESTVPQTESGSEIQSAPMQEGTQENSSEAVEAQNSTPEPVDSTQSQAES